MSNVVQMRRRVPTWSFGERVRKVRREAGMTQAEFANVLGVGRQAYASWEVDRHVPPRMGEVAERLEEVTGVAREWFLGWADGGSGPVGPAGIEPTTSTVKARRLVALPSVGAPRMRELAVAS
jgi:DNA-binding XRE family transcriptional regulator